VIHAYFGYNDVIMAIIKPMKRLPDIASLNKEKSRKSMSVFDSMHCINEAICCLGNNEAYPIIEEALTSLKEPIKSVYATLYSAKLHFPVKLQVIPNTFLL
jgi:hypothetical protein